MSVFQLPNYGSLYDRSVAGSEKLKSAKPLFSNSKKLVEIIIFLACAKTFWRRNNADFYETAFISLWSTVFQLFNFKIEPSFEFSEVRKKMDHTLFMFWHIQSFNNHNIFRYTVPSQSSWKMCCFLLIYC